MALLPEYSLIPDIFDTNSYSDRITGHGLLGIVMDEISQGGLISDLYNGEWYKSMVNQAMNPNIFPFFLHQLKIIFRENRLISRPCQSTSKPKNDIEWCQEAIALSGLVSLQGIICSDRTQSKCFDHNKLSSISNLYKVDWWQNRNSFVEVQHTVNNYKEFLEPIIQSANSLIIIDRFLDPKKQNYKIFLELLQNICSSVRIPDIEIHRTNYIKNSGNKNILSRGKWEKRFRNGMRDFNQSFKQKISVFLWEEFHERYLITNVVGIHSGNSFQIDKYKDRTIWSRLNKVDKEAIESDFDETATTRAKPKKFKLY